MERWPNLGQPKGSKAPYELQVAIKQIPKSKSNQIHNFKQMLDNEYEVLKKLNSKHVV